MNINKKLNNGLMVPIIGLGVYNSMPGDETYNAVRYALDYNYKHVDTAAMYNNENDVGRAVADSKIKRESLTVVTKMWPSDFDKPREAFFTSLKNLSMDYVDMYLLHWPHSNENLRFKAYEECLKLAEEGYIKAVGVSNFLIPQLEGLINKFEVQPVTNQIELHPWYQQKEVCAYCEKKGIEITAWGPIFHGHLEEEPLVHKIGEEYGKSAAQVTLRWHLQKGNIIIPKSVKAQRIQDNFNLFDFELRKEDMEKIDALDGKQHFSFDANIFDGNMEKARESRNIK